MSRINIKYKTIIGFFLAASLSLTPSFAWADSKSTDVILGKTVEERQLAIAKCPSIYATNAYMVEKDGQVLFERGADERVQIASITKVMTAYVALLYGALTDEVVVSENASGTTGSTAELNEGDVMTLENALKAMMVPSGNDAAVAIAESVGAKVLNTVTDFGTEEKPTDAMAAFVALMNLHAAKLGMVNTYYTNPHGLDFDEYAGCYSSAHDQAILCEEAMTNQTFRDIVAIPETITIPVKNGAETKDLELEPTDKLFESFGFCIGIKTGNTDNAGACYAGAMNYFGYEVYAIVLNSVSETDRFKDAQDLFEWAIAHRVAFYLVQSSKQTVEMTENGETFKAPVIANVAHDDWIDKTFQVTADNPRGFFYTNDINGNVTMKMSYDKTSGTIHAGDVVGTITYYQQNQVVYTANLIACEDCAAPNIFESAGIFFDRMLRQVRGEQTVAVTQEVYVPQYLNAKNTAA